MKHFFTTLLHIELTDFDEDYLEIMPGINLTNDFNKIKKLFNEDIRLLIGGIEYQHISKSKSILYFEYSNDDIKQHFSDINNLQFLNLILLWTDDFLKSTWLIKDNCISCDTAYLIDDVKLENGECSSQRLNYLHTATTGGIYKTTFSKAEILDTIKIHEKLQDHLISKDSSSLKFSMIKDFSRIGRFMFFIKNGRESRNLGHKLLNYCSALEALFSSDNTEIAHKIGERAAFFMCEERKKIEIFSLVKKAYEIRSKLTHGASIDNKLIEKMPEISFEIDSLLRAIILKIMNNDSLIEIFESNNQILNDYFNELIFK